MSGNFPGMSRLHPQIIRAIARAKMHPWLYQLPEALLEHGEDARDRLRAHHLDARTDDAHAIKIIEAHVIAFDRVAAKLAAAAGRTMPEFCLAIMDGDDHMLAHLCERHFGPELACFVLDRIGAIAGEAVRS